MFATTFQSLSFCCSFLLVFSAVAGAQSAVPDCEVSESAWASVREAYDIARHEVRSEGAGFEARNPEQRWSLEFDTRGVLVEPDSSDWSWGLELVSYGFEDAENFVGDSACATAWGGRVVYAWDDGIEEWYVNDARRFEHGFTVHERPLGAGAGALTLVMQVRGELTPQVSADRRGLDFCDGRDGVALSYSGLTVFDADGEKLNAWFEFVAGEILLRVEETQARYPLTIDPVIYEVRLKASNPQAGDRFGLAVANYGDTIVVAAPFEDSASIGVGGSQNNNNANDAGAVYVFVRNGSTWSQEAYLKASNTGPGDEFGHSVSMWGDTVVVGAWREDSSSNGINGDQSGDATPDSGVAYVFVRTGTVWSQQAFIKSSNRDAGDMFGTSVALSQDTLVVGALGEDSAVAGVNGNGVGNFKPNSGAAYVFVRNGSVWSQEAYIKASNPDSADLFGVDVALSGDTLVVGAHHEGSPSVGVNGPQGNNTAFRESGAAYVFARSASTWSQEAYIKASNTDMFDEFGRSVGLDGDTLIVGAPYEGSDATGVNGSQANVPGGVFYRGGASYVFARTGSTWAQEAYLKASNTRVGLQFGTAVAVSGGRFAVGAPGDAVGSSGVNGDEFEIPFASHFRGSAYVFEPNGSSWSQVGYLKATNTAHFDMFGGALSMSGGTLVVGSAFEDSLAAGVNDIENDGALDSGAAYIFDVDFNLPALPPVGLDLCSGDGGDQMGCTDCPCANNAPAGTIGGCLNSAARSARLIAAGDLSVSLPSGSTTDLRFTLTGAAPLSFCILTSGEAVAPDNAMNPCAGLSSGVQAMQFDGLRCAIINTRRHGGRASDSLGDAGLTGNSWGGGGGPPVGIAQAGGGFVSGQTRYFQVINRDDATLSCMRGLNTSQAVEITFVP